MFIYRPKRSFGQGNIFTSVCHSVHRGGGRGPGQVPPPSRQAPPPGRHPPRQAPPPPARDTVKARPVRILLECILVYIYVLILLVHVNIVMFCLNLYPLGHVF